MNNMSYEEALQELQQIVTDLQAEGTAIDQLTDKAKRAAELIQFCRAKLRETETVVGKLFAEDQDH